MSSEETRRIADLRSVYSGESLSAELVGDDPIELFEKWLAQAIETEVPEPTAMTLATVSGAQPTARVVLLKGFDASGLVFYTSYGSRKGREIASNSACAAVLFWQPLHRQIRVEGSASKVESSLSDEYFASRPRGSQVSAASSPQSEPIESRAQLEVLTDATQRRFEGGDVERPEGWGGYRIEPHAFEFWQGRPDRLHDRFRFERTKDGWRRQRLAP